MKLRVSSNLNASILLVACAGMLAPAFAQTAAGSYPSDGGLAAKIQPFVDNNIIPGAVLLVADKDKILDLESVGYSDIDKKVPMDPNNLFMICSMTKTVTAAGLMMLVDEGKVNLDDPVEKYLPAFKGQMVVDEMDPAHTPHPASHPITVREIMSHMAGLHRGPRRESPTTTVADASELGKLPLMWQPGTKYEYSQGPLVGGAVIEVASGMPYAEFIKERVLDPLGMTDSTYWPTAEQAPRLALTAMYNPATKKLEDIHHNDAQVHDPDKCGPVPPRVLSQTNLGEIANYKNHFARPDADLFSTAIDFSKFGQMLLNNGTYNGKQYLSPAAVKQMATIQTGNHFPGNTEGYGICTFIQKNPSPDGPSPGSFGHRGARKTVFWVDPADGLVLVFMTQAWDIKPPDQKALNAAFFKSAIAKYGKGGPATASN
jgi:CubicO group peptidase (beta-lactamase class C family)